MKCTICQRDLNDGEVCGCGSHRAPAQVVNLDEVRSKARKDKRIVVGLLCWIFCLALSACGGGGDTPPQQEPAPVATEVGSPVAGAMTMSTTLGAGGGTLATADGKLVVEVPAGALTADATITIVPITNNAHGGIGDAYRLTSDGPEFLQPVSITFTYTDEEVVGTAQELLDVAFQTPEGFWQLSDTVEVDTALKTVRATTKHFNDWSSDTVEGDTALKTVRATTKHDTDWSFVARFRLTPSAATVHVDDGQVFQIEQSFPVYGERSNPSESRPILGFDWIPIGVQRGAAIASNWSVNDVPGGTSTLGTIYANYDRGGYAAPSTKPSPAKVSVSVLVTNPQNAADWGKLTAPVTITDEVPAYTGSFDLTIGRQADAYTVAGSGRNVVWTQVEDIGDVRKYKMASGTISATLTFEGCLPATVDVPSSMLNGLTVYTDTNAAFPQRYSFGVSHFGSAAGGSDTFTVKCGEDSVEFPVSFINFQVGFCYTLTPLGSDLPVFTDETVLQDTAYSSSCDPLPTVSGSWNFSQ